MKTTKTNNTVKKQTAAEKALAKIVARIKKTTDEFRKASAAEKRVMIAKDVLAQIKSRRYIPEHAVWVRPTFSPNSELMCDVDGDIIYNSDTQSDISVQELWTSKELQTCSVCALGGMFMSCVGLNNNTTIENLNEETECLSDIIVNEGHISNGLNKFFTRSQLALIEIYFEGGNGGFYIPEFLDGYYGPVSSATRKLFSRLDDDENYVHLTKFDEKYQTPSDRMKAIMTNIVENNGTFKPETLKV